MSLALLTHTGKVNGKMLPAQLRYLAEQLSQHGTTLRQLGTAARVLIEERDRRDRPDLPRPMA